MRVSAFLPFQLTRNLKGAAAPLDSRLRGSDGVWGLRVDLSGFAISVVRSYFRYLPLFSSSYLTPLHPRQRPVVLPNVLSSSLIPFVAPPDSPSSSHRPVVAPHSPSSSLIPIVGSDSPSSSAQAEDPVRVSAFLPFQLTRNLKGAAAPLDSRLRGSDGIWGSRG